MKNFTKGSKQDSRLTIRIPSKLKKEANKRKLNLSKICRDAIEAVLASKFERITVKTLRVE